MILSLVFHVVADKHVSSQHGMSFKKEDGGWDRVGLIDSMDDGCLKVTGGQMCVGSCF